MVVVVNGMSHAWRRVRDWLSPGFLPACRSGDDEPNGGVVGWIWSIRRKSSQENFSNNEEVVEGFWSFLGRRWGGRN